MAAIIGAMQIKPKSLAVAVAALGVELAADSAPVDFRIIPAGEFRAWDGRPAECAAWVCTEEDGQRIVAGLNARASACVIDYEHATLRAKTTSQPAPAAGWFKQAEWRDDGVWLIGVDWTALAAQQIADKQYRFISPVFPYDPKTGRVLALYHAALTNDPGMDGLTDLAALAATYFLDQPTTEENPVNEELLEQLRWLLNLPVGATAEEITAQLQKLIDQIKGGNPVAANAAAFDIGAHIAALSAKVAQPDPAQFVPIATLSALQGEHASLQGRFVALQAEVAGGKLEQIVADGLAAGKLTPATEAWARDLGKNNLAALSAFLTAAPVIAKPGETQSGGQIPVGGSTTVALSAEQKAVCAALGMTHEQFIAANKEA